jgi:hypothetical protein
MGLNGLHVLESLLFHIDECDNTKECWDKLDSLFGNVNEFRALQLEVKLSSLVPDENASIEDYISEFKLLVAYMKGCGKNKPDKEWIFLILPELKYHFQVFSSTCYSTMDALGDEFKMTSFDISMSFLPKNNLSLWN